MRTLDFDTVRGRARIALCKRVQAHSNSKHGLTLSRGTIDAQRTSRWRYCGYTTPIRSLQRVRVLSWARATLIKPKSINLLLDTPSYITVMGGHSHLCAVPNDGSPYGGFCSANRPSLNSADSGSCLSMSGLKPVLHMVGSYSVAGLI